MRIRGIIALGLRGALVFVLALFVLSFAAVLVIGRDPEAADLWKIYAWIYLVSLILAALEVYRCVRDQRRR